jgi:general secretion pathway protein N
MKRRMLAMALGATYVLALVATAPATLISPRLQRASEGRLHLAEPQGTLWSGIGQLEVRDERGRSGMARPLTWRLRPEALLLARLEYNISLDPGTRPFAVTIRPSSIELADADIALPASALGFLVPKLAPLGLSGDMDLHVERLLVGRNLTRGQATLKWRNASSALSPVSPLGEYEIRLAGDGPAASVTLSTLKGPLQLQGQGAWGGGRKAAFLASAQMPLEYQKQLAPFLRLIAVERGDGSFALQLK